MKARVYMRIARNTGAWKKVPFKVEASASPNPRPLMSGSEQLHTVQFVLAVEIADELFQPAKWPVIEIELGLDDGERVPVMVEIEPPAAVAS